MTWIVLHPEQVFDLMEDPHFRPSERYRDLSPVEGEIGCLTHPATREVTVRFVVQETILPARVMVTDHRPITIAGLPDGPELFRLTEQPLGLCPFHLTAVALACMPCPQEPNG